MQNQYLLYNSNNKLAFCSFILPMVLAICRQHSWQLCIIIIFTYYSFNNTMSSNIFVLYWIKYKYMGCLIHETCFTSINLFFNVIEHIWQIGNFSTNCNFVWVTWSVLVNDCLRKVYVGILIGSVEWWVI